MTMGRATLKLDTSAIGDLVGRLDKIGGNVKEAVNNALEQTAETIEEDTIDAVQDRYLPAKGRYSAHDKPTEKSIVRKSKVEWSGNFASINVGFDYSKRGAGGYLISGYYYNHGTPRHMDYDKPLHKMYKGKKYLRDLTNDMAQVILDAIQKAKG